MIFSIFFLPQNTSDICLSFQKKNSVHMLITFSQRLLINIIETINITRYNLTLEEYICFITFNSLHMLYMNIEAFSIIIILIFYIRYQFYKNA